MSSRSGKKRGDDLELQQPQIVCNDNFMNEPGLPKKVFKCVVMLVMLVMVVFVCIPFLFGFVVVIPAGQVGVVDTFGRVSESVLDSGWHFLNPFSRVIKFSLQTQIVAMSEDVPSKEGMTVHLEAAVLFHLDPHKAVTMYKEVGIDYVDRVVMPQFRSVLRSVTSGHDAKDLYSAAARNSMTASLKEELVELMQPRGLVVESTPLKNLLLPETLQHAIQEKLKAEQDSQKMEFVLQKETQEAERKTIEARGIQQFQDIVRKGIDEHLLQWKGIEATEKLAMSPNAKIVMIGAGTQGGLPILLNPPL